MRSALTVREELDMDEASGPTETSHSIDMAHIRSDFGMVIVSKKRRNRWQLAIGHLCMNGLHIIEEVGPDLRAWDVGLNLPHDGGVALVGS